MDKPKSGKGVMIVLALVAFVFIARYASTWGGIAVIALGIALVAYALYAAGFRFNRVVLGK